MPRAHAAAAADPAVYILCAGESHYGFSLSRSLPASK